MLLAGMLLGCNRSGVVMPETYGPRPPHEGSSPYSDRVIAYVPAPGQFINDAMVGFDGNETGPQAALEYADRRLHSVDASLRGMVSLGGFGGYIVVGFDHSIQASGGYGGYDFSITGNQFSGSSEPGVVWVMPDENGNGEPDDGPWYELRGAYSDSSVRSYSVTYYRPDREDAAVRWRDSEGHEGEIARVSSHPQSYYPKWMTEESYTLSGTLLPDRSGTLENGRFTTGDYGWGYADNWGEDMLEAPKQKNFFRISDAVDAAGEAAGLDYIDFVKVQTGVNIQGGAGIGELSTEVSRFRDENLLNGDSPGRRPAGNMGLRENEKGKMDCMPAAVAGGLSAGSGRCGICRLRRSRRLRSCRPPRRNDRRDGGAQRSHRFGDGDGPSAALRHRYSEDGVR